MQTTIINGKASFQLINLVRQDRPVKLLSDPVGKSFAVDDKRCCDNVQMMRDWGVSSTSFKNIGFIGIGYRLDNYLWEFKSMEFGHIVREFRRIILDSIKTYLSGAV